MPIYNKIANFKPVKNPAFLEKAKELDPVLLHEAVSPISVPKDPLGKGDSVYLDFGDHEVGYLSFHVTSVGSPADAPAKLRIRYMERPFEKDADWEHYEGSVSSSWLQEEIIFVDEIPSTYKSKRRHAFRYVEILVLDTTPKYKIKLSHVVCDAVSSADYSKLVPANIKDPELAAIDRIAVRTMQQCMQSVFEDGPKRDRRLWLGDLRLQALGNYATFQNNDLVKRCLYLFAGMTVNDGTVGACLFHDPIIQVDDTVLFDYSLMFVTLLKEYGDHVDDLETLRELYPTAKKQIELSQSKLDEHGLVVDHDYWWCFLDWTEGLNKQAGAQAILIQAISDAIDLGKRLNEDVSDLEKHLSTAKDAAMAYLYDKKRKVFLSGASRQLSWASQIFFVLSGILTKEEGRDLLLRMENEKEALPMTTPYLHHHYVVALLKSGLKDKAVSVLKSYWGGMVKDGADTFYEVFVPGDPDASPYGNKLINSYCHAWSSTPAYIIRTYLLED